ncbi:MAG: DUF4825 domain-containing protein [Oscillospiraceae bacterium]|nr:DUF4825 domain-containing protein [Oscillospiraceae bacterium]
MSVSLKCEIVKDLLPSYVDGQTGDVTNRAVEEHVSGCPDCAEALRRMQEPERDPVPQKQEIDYLKKIRRSKRRAVWLAAAATLMILLAALCLRVFVYGNGTDLSAHDVSIQVTDDVLQVSGSLAGSGEGVARVTFAEKDGVIDIRLFTAPATPFNRGSFSKVYTARTGPIRAVTSGGIVIWENGGMISRVAGRLYAAKNPYVGDMPANQVIANAIGISERYGTYQNELHTAEEPYGWVILLDDSIEPAQEAKIRQRMRSDACLMLAAVDNLGYVTWRYENGSGRQEYTVTEKEASQTAGADIKSFAGSASGMQQLVDAVR